MSTQATLEELKALRRPLLEDASPLCAGDKHPNAPLFQKAETHYLDALRQQTLYAAPDRGFSASTLKFINHVFSQSDEGKAERLKTEISLLQQMKENEGEAILSTPYQITQAVFPIRLLNETVHCLFTGPLKIGPFTSEDFKALAQATGLSEETLRAEAKEVPTYSGDDVVQLFEIYRAQASALESALASHIHTRKLTEQVLQSESSPSLGTLSGGISNHFNGLLSIILGYASFVDNREELSEESKKALQQVMEAAQRGRRLSEELLSLEESGAEEECSPSEKKVTPRILASHIWIVDDDPLFRQMCAQILQGDGHNTLEFSGGGEMQTAWASRSEEPDLMVLDFSMPEYNGLEIRKWLHAQGSSLPVVLVSGLAPSQPDIKKALAMKKTYFLQKPFSYRELSDITSIAMGETLIGE